MSPAILLNNIEYCRDDLPFMERDRGLPPVSVAILPMGPSQADFDKPELLKNGYDFSRFRDR